LTAVIIVLREVLEAALLISILSALSGLLGVQRQWISWSLICGIAGAVLLAYKINPLSELFDGVGQEISSAGIQLLIFLLLTVFSYLVLLRSEAGSLRHRSLKIIMAGIVALAVTREGFEVLIYVSGFAQHFPQLATVLVGATIGASIGVSVGVLIYYSLYYLRYPWAQFVGMGLLILVAAGLASQVALLLIQADWLPSQLPLWDTSAVIAEDSFTGQLLYAMIGYEATPSAIQAGFYIGGGLLLLQQPCRAF